jgi:hypothetical protein
MPSEEALRSHRTAIYFDCICGSIWSIIAFICIALTVSQEGIFDLTNFIVWLIFWIVNFSAALFLIILGIYTRYQEKHYVEKSKKRKDIKPPII